MPPRVGYLLPTRERVMEGRPETALLLDLAARAESLGFDSIWVGDSLLARPHTAQHVSADRARRGGFAALASHHAARA